MSGSDFGYLVCRLLLLLLPHCSEVVNTSAAACQLTVKYCLCSTDPVSLPKKTAPFSPLREAYIKTQTTASLHFTDFQNLSISPFFINAVNAIFSPAIKAR